MYRTQQHNNWTVPHIYGNLCNCWKNIGFPFSSLNFLHPSFQRFSSLPCPFITPPHLLNSITSSCPSSLSLFLIFPSFLLSVPSLTSISPHRFSPSLSPFLPPSLPGLSDGVLRQGRRTVGEGLPLPASNIGPHSDRGNDRC